ncbi:MAG: GMC family oxidoreductase [Actinomycetota bacterium]
MRPDIIVVGAGTAGCVVARRLFDAGLTVRLVEAGPGEPRPEAVLGADPVAAAEQSDRQWSGLLAAAADDAPGHRYRQGYGIGGGSAINAMILSPGDDADYRRWADQHGCPEWGPADLAPWIDRVTATWPTETVPPGPVTRAFVQAAAEAGHPVGGDTLEPGVLGVLETRLSLSGDRRVSSFDQLIKPAIDGRDGNRLQVLAGRHVTRILTDGDRPAGVVLDDGTELAATRVVVCGGAVWTPQLLLASGIGRPSVGRTLRDHPSYAFTVQLRPGTSADRSVSGPVSRLLRWSSGDGDGDGGDADLQAFVIERVDTPDTLDKAGHQADIPDGNRRADRTQYAVVVVGLMDVSSVGRTVPGQTAGQPSIITGALDTEHDRRRLRAGVRHVNGLLDSPPMAAVVEQVYLDDRGTSADELPLMPDDRLDRMLLANPGPYSHPVATCPMGPAADPAAVVSDAVADGGMVHGHRGVHVIDASIMPNLVRGGLQLPVTAVAERLAAALVTRFADDG